MKKLCFMLTAALLLVLCACTSEKQADLQPETPDISESAVSWDGLTFDRELPLSYATQFSVSYAGDDYTRITIGTDQDFLLVAENAETPEHVPESVTVLHRPLSHIYLVASAAMDYFDHLGAVGSIALSGLKAGDWYIESAKAAMEEGSMRYAGKYSAPDYEAILESGCDLAIEDTMIYHTPKVKEMIEDLGIPVLVDRSSYEQHPLGRTEWIKLYAALVGKDAEAAEFFDQQAAIITQLEGFENTGKTVAFFFVNSDGSIVIRKPTDYIPKMIELAGGRYAFENFVTDQTNTSVSVTMETFYGTAVDADVLIYNASIDAPISSINELLAKDALFADFKAVQEGNVWCTGKSFYQATDIVGEMIRDIHLALTGGAESDMTFLTRVS